MAASIAGRSRCGLATANLPSSAYATFSPIFHYDATLRGIFRRQFLDGRDRRKRFGNPPQMALNQHPEPRRPEHAQQDGRMRGDNHSQERALV